MLKGFLLALLAISITFSFPMLDIYIRSNCKIGSNEIYIPYFANLYATKLILDRKENPETIKEYILWYVRNLNYPDTWGLTGTIYDFYFKDGRLLPTYNYDSADSYASTFLSLLYFYIKITGDFEIIEQHLREFKDIAYIILYLKDNKYGLIKALPYRDVKYLIDNLESYVGLILFSQLLKSVGDRDWYYFKRHALELKGSIKRHFDSDGVLYWAIEKETKHPVGNQTYPDYLAIIFWRIFKGESLSEGELSPLDCSQVIAVETFRAAYIHTIELKKSYTLNMAYRCMIITLEGNDKEITEKLNEVLSTIEEEGGDILDVETSLVKEHGIDGLVVVYTIKYKSAREVSEE